MKIWVVMGSTGEYSDHTEWSICYYADETLAQNHVDRATECAQPWVLERANGRSSIPRGANPWDPFMVIDYTGVNYYVYGVEQGPLQIPEAKLECVKCHKLSWWECGQCNQIYCQNCDPDHVTSHP